MQACAHSGHLPVPWPILHSCHPQFIPLGLPSLNGPQPLPRPSRLSAFSYASCSPSEPQSCPLSLLQLLPQSPSHPWPTAAPLSPPPLSWSSHAFDWLLHICSFSLLAHQVLTGFAAPDASLCSAPRHLVRCPVLRQHCCVGPSFKRVNFPSFLLATQYQNSFPDKEELASFWLLLLAKMPCVGYGPS